MNGSGSTGAAAAGRPRVLLISHDVVSRHMAGPGIRWLELARVLADDLDVWLATPNPCDLALEAITLRPYRLDDWPSLAPACRGADVLVVNGFTLLQFPALAELPVPLVVDLYDPFLLENLYLTAPQDGAGAWPVHQRDLRIVQAVCGRGDFFLCATERQRDWWLGVLTAQGRVNPLTVRDDPSLRRLIDTVPFGLPADPPPAAASDPRAQWPELPADARLILWGGGLWDWLDPLTLIRAMPAVRAQEPRACLLFPGTRHPNPAVPTMARTTEAVELAERLGLRGETVFFGEWVPYEAWPALLAAAEVAVSLHHDTLETRFAAVRSRVLSYIWARLPMVVTDGDEASQLVAQYGLGEVVAEGAVEQVSAALLRVLAQGKAPYATRFEGLAGALTWRRVAAPLRAFCHAPRRAADHGTCLAVPGHAAAPSQPDAIQQRLVAQADELRRLEARIQDYERGRFMRLMREVERWKHKIHP